MLRNITDKLPFISATGQKSLLAHMRSICTKQWTTEFFFFYFCFSRSYFFLPKKPRSLDTFLCGLLVIKTVRKWGVVKNKAEGFQFIVH